MYGSGPILARGPAAYILPSPIYNRLSNLSFMPELSDILRTDQQQHIGGTKGIVADTASYLASEVYNIIYNKILKFRYNMESKNGILDNPLFDIEKLDQELRILRRAYLSRVRETIEFMSLSHMLAIPPYRRIIGTQIKRSTIKILLNKLTMNNDNKTIKDKSKIINIIAELSVSIIQTLHNICNTYKKLYYMSKKGDIEAEITLPGGLKPNNLERIINNMCKLYDPYRIAEIMFYGMTSKTSKSEDYYRDLVEQLTTSIIYEIRTTKKKHGQEALPPNTLRIITYLTKYKISGIIIGLLVTTISIAEEIANIVEQLVASFESTNPPEEGLHPNEAQQNILLLISENLKSMEGFAAGAHVPFSPPLYYNIVEDGDHFDLKIYNKSYIIDTVPKLYPKIPCCLLELKDQRGTTIPAYTVSELALLATLDENFINKNKNIEKILYEYGLLNEVGELGFGFLWLHILTYIESEKIPSAFIIDMLSKLHVDLWMGAQPSLINIQEFVYTVREEMRNLLGAINQHILQYLDGILTTIATTTRQPIRYWVDHQQLLASMGGVSGLAYIYYTALQNTIEDLLNKINNIIVRIEKLEHYLQEPGQKRLKPLTKIYYLLKIYKENILQPVKQLAQNYYNFINILKTINIEKMKYEDNIDELTELGDIRLEELNDYILNVIMLNRDSFKEDITILLENKKYYNIKITTDKIASRYYQKYGSTLPFDANYTNKIYLLLLYFLTLSTPVHDIGSYDPIVKLIKNRLINYIRKELNSNINVDDNDLTVLMYIPIRGIVKLYYHYANRPAGKYSYDEHIELGVAPIPPYNIIISVIINNNGEIGDLILDLIDKNENDIKNILIELYVDLIHILESKLLTRLSVGR